MISGMPGRISIVCGALGTGHWAQVHWIWGGDKLRKKHAKTVLASPFGAFAKRFPVQAGGYGQRQVERPAAVWLGCSRPRPLQWRNAGYPVRFTGSECEHGELALPSD